MTFYSREREEGQVGETAPMKLVKRHVGLCRQRNPAKWMQLTVLCAVSLSSRNASAPGSCDLVKQLAKRVFADKHMDLDAGNQEGRHVSPVCILAQESGEESHLEANSRQIMEKSCVSIHKLAGTTSNNLCVHVPVHLRLIKGARRRQLRPQRHTNTPQTPIWLTAGTELAAVSRQHCQTA